MENEKRIAKTDSANHNKFSIQQNNVHKANDQFIFNLIKYI